MGTTSLGQELFTTETQGDSVLFKVDGDTVAIASPINFTVDVPGFQQAWNVTLFAPFGGSAGAIAVDEEAARELAELYARTAARAVAR